MGIFGRAHQKIILGHRDFLKKENLRIQTDAQNFMLLLIDLMRT